MALARLDLPIEGAFVKTPVLSARAAVTVGRRESINIRWKFLLEISLVACRVQSAMPWHHRLCLFFVTSTLSLMADVNSYEKPVRSSFRTSDRECGCDVISHCSVRE